MNDLPHVLCIMPTRNRTRFVAKAIDCFLKQDYPNKHLLIFEEESQSLDPDLWRERNESRPYVIYKWSPTLIYKSIGEKRNAMCRLAFEYNGEMLIAHWDDDDWHSPRRLSTQVEQMRAQGARLCGANSLVFYNGERSWLFKTPRRPWLAGGTLMYERSLWLEQPFQEVSDGEDTAFVDAAHKRNVKMSVIEDPSLYVAMLHGANTTKRDTTGWGSFDVQQVRRWIEEPACSD